ncbi:hypothetical protein OIU84_011223 [Salix udensis]|uniref:RHOMBOID-like protein n=1 Tax=Salix udensis TaxID=889485 RepID=A0AAD6JMU5_9ROSI|nr:hypothetical protein OIU84_011223 [Salix udensis]
MEKEQYPVPPSETRRGGNNSIIIHPAEIDTPNHQVSPAMKSSSSPSPVVFGRIWAFQEMVALPFKENPLLGPSSMTLQKMGALDVKKVVDGHQGWRLISCNWLHGGVFHLLANMLSILVIGIRLEQEFGFVKVGLLYIISGFGGSLLSALFIQSNISVGASGALFGLLGGMLSELITNWTIYANKVAAFITLVVIIAVNLAGIFHPSAKSKFKTYQCALWIISLVLLIAGFTIGTILLLRGVDANEHCSWCHYLSCVPTAKWSCKTEPAYCLSTQIGNQLNLTCSSNGKSSVYLLPGATDSQIQGLCTDLCR